MNSVNLIGRLTRDPEVRTTTSGKKVANFGIAVNSRGKDDTADFFNCVAWEKTADFVGDYLEKGRLVAVEGRLQSRKYTDKDGNNRSTVEVVAFSVTALDRPKGDEHEDGESGTTNDEWDPFADE